MVLMHFSQSNLEFPVLPFLNFGAFEFFAAVFAVARLFFVASVAFVAFEVFVAIFGAIFPSRSNKTKQKMKKIKNKK